MQESYDFELDFVVREVKRLRARLVCIQLPDGLKPEAMEIAGFIEKNSKTKVLIWGSTCYGACDIPLGLEKLGVDLLIHFGHNNKLRFT